MEYSKIDKLNVNPSLLGFGCMRFPKKEDGTIDEVEAERMLDYARKLEKAGHIVLLKVV